MCVRVHVCRGRLFYQEKGVAHVAVDWITAREYQFAYVCLSTLLRFDTHSYMSKIWLRRGPVVSMIAATGMHVLLQHRRANTIRVKQKTKNEMHSFACVSWHKRYVDAHMGCALLFGKRASENTIFLNPDLFLYLLCIYIYVCVCIYIYISIHTHDTRVHRRSHVIRQKELRKQQDLVLRVQTKLLTVTGTYTCTHIHA